MDERAKKIGLIFPKKESKSKIETSRTEAIFFNFWALRLLYGWREESRRPRTRVTIIFGIIFVVGLLVCWLDHSLVLTNHDHGYLQDTANYFFILGMIFSFSLARTLQKKFIYAFWGHGENLEKGSGLLAVVKEDQELWDEYEASFKDRFAWISLEAPEARKWFYVIQMIIAAIYLTAATLLPLLTKQTEGNWNFLFVVNGTHFSSYLWCQIKDFWIYVVLMPSALWQIYLITRSTIHLVGLVKKHNCFEIIPLSPDNAGGLKPLGNIALILFYIVVVQLMHILATDIIRGFPIHDLFLTPLVMLFAAYVFFLPLGTVHSSMKKAKRDELDRIAREYNHIYYKYRGEIDGRDSNPKAKIDHMKEMQSIKDLYHQADEMPVWPFDRVTISKFLSMFLIPLGVILAELITRSDSILFRMDEN